MKDHRIGFFVSLICLPAALIIGFGATWILLDVPRAIRNEPSRIGREYREIAEDFIAHPERATFVGERQKGWQQVSRISGVPWGYERDVDNDGRLARIWFKSGPKEWRAIVVRAIRPFPYASVFYGGGLLVALSLIGLTSLAVVLFLRYVKSRDDFLAATAHDLTTPLVGMRMMIGRADDEAKRLNERMLLIVSNIKDFLRLGGKRRKPELKPVDIVALTKEAYQLFVADYEDSESGAVVFEDQGEGPRPTEEGNLHCSPSPSNFALITFADSTLTLQILWNLFGNDLKYAAPYGKVTVRFVQEAGFVRVEFIDEGQGMTPQQMKKAFDRYYRAKTVLESGKGGFGIGLCTAREFARAMGGDLTVRANTPKGCVFTLSLPLRSGQETASPLP